MIMNLVFTIVVIAGSLLNMAYLHWQNKKKNRAGYRENVLAKYQGSDGEKDAVEANLRAWIELGDRHPDFRYTL